MSRVRSPYWPILFAPFKALKSGSLWYLYMRRRCWIDQWGLWMPSWFDFGCFWNDLLRRNRFNFWPDSGRFSSCIKMKRSHWSKFSTRKSWHLIGRGKRWNSWKYSCATDETDQLLEELDYKFGLSNPEVIFFDLWFTKSNIQSELRKFFSDSESTAILLDIQLCKLIWLAIWQLVLHLVSNQLFNHLLGKMLKSWAPPSGQFSFQ